MIFRVVFFLCVNMDSFFYFYLFIFWNDEGEDRLNIRYIGNYLLVGEMGKFNLLEFVENCFKNFLVYFGFI